MLKKNKKSFYTCKILVQSTSLKSLKLWVNLLPFPLFQTRLPVRISRFTLVKSPLGNKVSKEQFERRKYSIQLKISSKKGSKLLYFLTLFSQSIYVKCKVLYSAKLNI